MGIARSVTRSKTIDPANHPLINAKPKKTLLDVPGAVDKLKHVPGKIIEPPPIEEKGPSGLLDAVSRLAGRQGERKSIDAMRRMGLTKTIGQPGNHADLVHAQEAATCAIVTQQQVLTAYGLVEGEDRKAVEKRLRSEARRKGYFDDLGTAPQYAGSLLIDHGLIVSKRMDTTAADVEKVVRKGKFAIVGVDARYLWDLEGHPRPIGHSIILTGAEVSRINGKVLGYYYNDSGDDPPKGGGFITAEEFKQAFESRGGNFLEIQ